MTNDQATISRQLPSTKVQKDRNFDLEKRTLTYARRSRDFTLQLPKNAANHTYGLQYLRSSSSVGANYIEANEALSKKDFFNRIKISRKEAKESAYWLELVIVGDSSELELERQTLLQEARELTLIFNAILRKNTF